MASFKEANRVRISLKNKLSQFAWYHSSHVIPTGDDHMIIIHVSRLNNEVRKSISPVVDGVAIKAELE